MMPTRTLTEQRLRRCVDQASAAAREGGYQLHSLEVTGSGRWKAVITVGVGGTVHLERESFHGLMHEIAVLGR